MDSTAEGLIVLANLSLAACGIIGVFVAARFAWTTKRILKSNRDTLRKMSERMAAMERPYLDLRLQIDDHQLVLSIRNTGRTLARRVRLVLDRSVFLSADPRSRERLNDTFAFRHGVPSLAPNAELRFALGPSSPVGHHEEPFRVIAFYAGEHDEYAETTELDPRHLLDPALLKPVRSERALLN